MSLVHAGVTGLSARSAGIDHRSLRREDGFFLWRYEPTMVRSAGTLRSFSNALVDGPSVVAEHNGYFLGYLVASRVGDELRLHREDLRWCRIFSKSYVAYTMVRWLLHHPSQRGVRCFRFGRDFSHCVARGRMP